MKYEIFYLRAGGAVSIVCTRASLRHEHYPRRGIVTGLQHMVFKPRIESIHLVRNILPDFFRDSRAILPSSQLTFACFGIKKPRDNYHRFFCVGLKYGGLPNCSG